MSYADSIAPQVVPSFDLAYGHPVAHRNLPENISAAHPVDNPLPIATILYLLDSDRIEEFVSLVCVQRVFDIDVIVDIIVRNAQDVLLFISRDDLVPVLRVEVLQFLERNTCQFAYLLEMQHLVYLEGVYCRRHGDFLGFDSVFLVVFHCVQGAYECRDITSRFSRQIRVNVPECTLAAASSDCPVDIPCSAVVGSNGKIPVPEYSV